MELIANFVREQEMMFPSRGPAGHMLVGWSDEVGDHYFGWVQRSGWEYVFPRNPAQQPMRVVYVGLQVAQVGASSRPATPVSALCPLFPSN